MTIVGWQEVFTRRVYQQIIIDNLNFAVENRGLEIYSYVVMPNHIHMIANSENPLDNIIKKFKSFSARKIIDELQANEQLSRKERFLNSFSYHAQNDQRVEHQVWIHKNHPETIYSNEFFEQKREYIEMNPVEAGFVEEPHYWRLSSANEQSPIKIIHV
jgi:REP element-mobilizing transposase RayT